MHPHHARRIAVILSDTFQRIGLQHVLIEYFSPVEIFSAETYEQFSRENSDTFDFYFTSSDFFILYADFFMPRRNKTVVLTAVSGHAGNGNGGFYLSSSDSPELILEQIQNLFASEVNNNHPGETNKELSLREVEVLQLIVKGITNKEIADKLNISLNTVLTHRKNITSKLGIKTVSGLTFYAIMNGLISGDEIEL